MSSGRIKFPQKISVRTDFILKIQTSVWTRTKSGFAVREALVY
jgi:hypothetical protein